MMIWPAPRRNFCSLRFSGSCEWGALGPMAKLTAFLLALLIVGTAWAQETPPPGVKDLPLVELPADSPLPFLAVFLSGDGGWADLDRQAGGSLASGGIPVIGWNTLKYFLSPRTPEGATRDLERILAYYLDRWNKREVVLIGYSRGADILPFMTSRLPAVRLRQVRLLALLGPATHTQFQGLAADLLKVGQQAPVLPMRPELEKLRGLRILCFYGADETDTLCAGMDPHLAECVRLPGGHHFGGSYREIADRILSEL